MSDEPHVLVKADRRRGDIRLPLTVVGTMLVQTIALVWVAATYKSDLDTSLRDHERRIIQVEQAQAAQTALTERVVRVETKVEGAVDLLNRIWRRVDNERPVARGRP